MCNAIGLRENGLTHTGQETKSTTIWENCSPQPVGKWLLVLVAYVTVLKPQSHRPQTPATMVSDPALVSLVMAEKFVFLLAFSLMLKN